MRIYDSDGDSVRYVVSGTGENRETKIEKKENE